MTLAIFLVIIGLVLPTFVYFALLIWTGEPVRDWIKETLGKALITLARRVRG